jgi:hypothetical protein
MSKLPELPEAIEINWPQLENSGLVSEIYSRGIEDKYGCAEFAFQMAIDQAVDCVPEFVFTADQMRAYAEQAIASVKREPLSEAQIASIYATWDQTLGSSFADLFRAIEAAHGITGRYKELK